MNKKSIAQHTCIGKHIFLVHTLFSVYALYGNSVEVSYLYLVQPVSLVLLNPLGVACMELQRHRRPALNAAAR